MSTIAGRILICAGGKVEAPPRLYDGKRRVFVKNDAQCWTEDQYPFRKP